MRPIVTPSLEKKKNGYELAVSDTMPYHRLNYGQRKVAIHALPDVLFCRTKEQLNGERTLTMRYRSEGENTQYLAVNNILLVRVNRWMDIQHMRITKVTKKFSGRQIEVIAEPVLNILKHRMAKSYITSIQNIGQYSVIMSQTAPRIPKIETESGNKYEAYTFAAIPDKQVYPSPTYTFMPYSENALSLFQGMEGSVLDKHGGELVKDNGVLYWYDRYGKDTNMSIEYKSNLTDITVTIDDTNMIGAVVPYVLTDSPNHPNQKLMQLAYNYGTGGTSTPNVSTVLYYWILNTSGNAQNYANAETIMLDVTDKEEDWAPIFAQGEDVWKRRIIKYGNEWLNVNKEGRSDVNVNMKVDFVNISDRPEYAEFKELANLQLGDSVTVRFPEFGIEAPVRIIGYEYDTLTDKLVNIELGQPKKKYLDKMNNNITQLNKAVNRGIRSN